VTYATTVNNNIADASLTTPSGTVVGQETDRGAYVLAIDGGPTIERAFTGQGVAATPPPRRLRRDVAGPVPAPAA
jgi:hypothetical protein